MDETELDRYLSEPDEASIARRMRTEHTTINSPQGMWGQIAIQVKTSERMAEAADELRKAGLDVAKQTLYVTIAALVVALAALGVAVWAAVR